MDFSNYIKFDGNLIKNQPVKITYSGFLFEKGSETVSIVYGFGSHWEHTGETQMEKTENGFTAEINLIDYSLFNFCFKNSNNEWDNNYGGNYVYEVKELEVEPAFILNENVIVEILDNLFEINMNEYASTKSSPIQESVAAIVEEPVAVQAVEEFEVNYEKNEATTIEESYVSSTEEASINQDIEQLFNDIYQPIVEENVQEIKEEVVEVASPIEEIAQEVTPVSEVVEPVNIIEEKVEDKQSLLTDILADHATTQEASKEAELDFNMNSLINEILSPIISSSTFEQEDLGEEYASFEKNDDNEVNTVIDGLITDIQKSVENKTSFNYIEETNEVESPVETIEETDEFNDEEVSLIETLASEAREEAAAKESTTALVTVDQPEETFLVSARSLGKFYMFKKRVKLAFYKLFKTVPKLLSSKFIENDNND